MIDTLQPLCDQLENVVDEQGSHWLNQARQHLEKLDGDLDSVANKLAFFSATAKRKLGLSLLSGEIVSGFIQEAYGQCDKVYLDHWSVTDAARVILLADTITSGKFAVDQLFQLCYRYGDGGERTSLIKGLALINLSDQSTEFIIDVARTNSLELFSALVHKNPWPAVRFPVSAFNQVVLKSLFMGINISNMEGLRAGRNPELGRMAADYVQERLDAGREIPESIWLAADATMLTKQGLTAWESALQSNETQLKHQLALAGCLWQTNLPASLQQTAQAFRCYSENNYSA
jgi:hypothetical protein